MISLSESTESFLFPIVEVGIVLGCLGVVLIPRIIYSALFLGFVFICVAFLYLLLNADFLAASQILIYVGAVNVLIVFAIMLVSKQSVDTRRFSSFGEIVSGLSVTGLFAFLLTAILNTSWSSSNVDVSTVQASTQFAFSNSTQIIGFHLLTDLLLPFELLSLLLLVALLGAITIARKESTIN